MIKISENAHAECNSGGGYELFIDKYINSKDELGKAFEKKQRMGGLFYATLSGTLNGYVEQHLRSLAADEETFDLKQVREEIAALKKELTNVYNINFTAA
jgi:hypothetical protein